MDGKACAFTSKPMATQYTALYELWAAAFLICAYTRIIQRLSSQHFSSYQKKINKYNDLTSPTKISDLALSKRQNY
jgi:hypothetical protein